MSTGGIALVLGQTPHQFEGLTVIGDIGMCNLLALPQSAGTIEQLSTG